MSALPQVLSRRRFLAGATAVCAAPHVQAETTADAVRVLRALPAAAFAGEYKTPSLRGYEGTVPGPTLRIKRGDELRVQLINELAEPTAIHWHGVRLTNPMDGVPQLTQAAVAARASFDYSFQPPDAGTFWYHAYAGPQIDQGLHGALIVEEPQGVEVDRDIVLILGMPDQPGSPLVRVNGAIRPDIVVKTGERLRLRMINASSARGLSVKLEGHGAWVMAIDGQPAEPFLARDSRIALGPGNRADLFIDTIHNPGMATGILAGARDEQPIARLVYESGGNMRAPQRPEPRPLPANPLPARIDLKSSLLDTLVVGERTERIAFVADNPGRWLIKCRMLERAAIPRRRCGLRWRERADQRAALRLSNSRR